MLTLLLMVSQSSDCRFRLWTAAHICHIWHEDQARDRKELHSERERDRDGLCMCLSRDSVK